MGTVCFAKENALRALYLAGTQATRAYVSGSVSTAGNDFNSSDVGCVTHSPQIAALADYHYLISKHEVDGRAESRVRLLERDERIEEIARMLGGQTITDTTKANAAEILAMAHTN